MQAASILVVTDLENQGVTTSRGLKIVSVTRQKIIDIVWSASKAIDIVKWNDSLETIIIEADRIPSLTDEELCNLITTAKSNGIPAIIWIAGSQLTRNLMKEQWATYTTQDDDDERINVLILGTD